MIRFEIAESLMTPNRQVIQVFDGEEFIASIVGSDGYRGVRIISKFFNEGLRGDFLPELGGWLGATGFGMIRPDDQVPAIEIFVRSPEARDYQRAQTEAKHSTS